MAIIFDGNTTKKSPEVFPGITLQSFIHPTPEYNDGYDATQQTPPDVQFSLGLFTFAPHSEWPATRFDIAEVVYITEGKGIIVCNNEQTTVKKGSVVYIPKGEIRTIKNISDKPFTYICIVYPAWQPEYETVIT
jgi:mannose-6-phosphate isomerase-like protein (cupin superfamily)